MEDVEMTGPAPVGQQRVLKTADSNVEEAAMQDAHRPTPSQHNVLRTQPAATQSISSSIQAASAHPTSSIRISADGEGMAHTTRPRQPIPTSTRTVPIWIPEERLGPSSAGESQLPGLGVQTPGSNPSVASPTSGDTDVTMAEPQLQQASLSSFGSTQTSAERTAGLSVSIDRPVENAQRTPPPGHCLTPTGSFLYMIRVRYYEPNSTRQTEWHSWWTYHTVEDAFDELLRHICPDTGPQGATVNFIFRKIDRTVEEESVTFVDPRPGWDPRTEGEIEQVVVVEDRWWEGRVRVVDGDGDVVGV